MPKVQRGKSIWPAPVYVARFTGGEVCRMSFYSLAGKPLDFDRGRRICCAAIGNERGWLARKETGTRNWHFDTIPRFLPADDIVHGEVEWDNEVFIDPFFLPKPAAVKSSKQSSLDKFVTQLNRFSPAELEVLSAAIGKRLETV